MVNLNTLTMTGLPSSDTSRRTTQSSVAVQYYVSIFQYVTNTS